MQNTIDGMNYFEELGHFAASKHAKVWHLTLQAEQIFLLEEQTEIWHKMIMMLVKNTSSLLKKNK